MSALLITVFTAGLLGSLHCAGMCGGFVAFYAGGVTGVGRRSVLVHGAYNAGRLLSYTMLGIGSGLFGYAIESAGALAGWQRAAAVVAGVLIALWGTHALLQARGIGVPALRAPRSIERGVGRALATLAGSPPGLKAFTVGLLSTFLPCGWLYAFAATAAGTGSPLSGALVMMVFWAGTLPVMAALGVGLQSLFGPLRRHLPTLSAVSLIVIGLLTVLDRAPAARSIGLAATGRVPVTAPLSLGEQVEAARGLSPDKVPCCDD